MGARVPRAHFSVEFQPRVVMGLFGNKFFLSNSIFFKSQLSSITQIYSTQLKFILFFFSKLTPLLIFYQSLFNNFFYFLYHITHFLLLFK
jgi:hypothetical protein